MKKLLIFLGVIAFSFSQGFDEKDPRAIIEKVKIFRLVQELDLTTEQSEKFFPKLRELRMIEKEFGKKKMEILLDLKRLIRDNAPEPEKEILKAIARYDEAHKKKFEDREKKMKEISMVLTPVQRAKYLIFQEEFNREIRKTIEEIKKHRRFKP